jgi:hypothetical protein
LGALFGGLLGHAFLYGLSPGWQLVSWVLIIVAIGFFSQAILELAKPLVNRGLTRWVSVINLLILTFAIVYTLWKIAFLPVKYYCIFGMVAIVGSFSVFIYRRTWSRGVVWFLMAVGLGVVSAFVFSFEWSLSPWFNHNDISHVILSMASLVIYKGVVHVLSAPVST